MARWRVRIHEQVAGRKMGLAAVRQAQRPGAPPTKPGGKNCSLNRQKARCKGLRSECIHDAVATWEHFPPLCAFHVANPVERANYASRQRGSDTAYSMAHGMYL